MYLEHFGLTRSPFSLTPDPAFLYLSDQHSLAYAMLEYGVHDQRGLTVLTGEIGMGKTTLLHRLLGELDGRILTIGNIFNTHQSFGTLLEWVCMAFGLPVDSKRPVVLMQALQDFLIAEHARGRHCLLIVDEAQNLSLDQLEQVRLLSNINSGEDLLLQIVLVGQPQLRSQLNAPRLVQLVQRITSEFHLTALELHDTLRYIRHRLRVAGGRQKPSIFSLNAIAAIHHFSFGIPRIINKLCEYGLVVAYARGEDKVTLDVLIEVLMAPNMGGRERRHLGPLDEQTIRRKVRGVVMVKQELCGVLAD